MNSIRISHIGLTEWESVFLETTISMASGMEVSNWQCVPDPQTADVVLLAPDGKGRRRFDSMRDGKAEPIQQITREFSRPITYTTLIAELRSIEEELHAAIPVTEDPSAPEVAEPQRDTLAVNTDPDDEVISALAGESRPARRFVEGTRFLGMLQEAIRSGTTTELTHPDYPPVTVFPKENVYTSLGDPVSTPSMFRASSLEFFKRDISDAIGAVMLSIDQRQPLLQLVYCAALYGSEGRMLRHANPDDKLFLVEMPDFDSIPYTAEHRSIASQMMDGPVSLSELVTMSGTDIGTVIDFCNACEACGLIRRGNAGPPESATDESDEHPDDNLSGKVRYLFDPR